MAILKQNIKGRNINTITVSGSADDIDSLQGILEGEVTEYTQESTGGSSAEYPAVLNTIKFSSKKDRTSASVTIRHADPAKGYPDLRDAVISKLDCSWETDTAADQCNVFYNNIK